MNVTTISARVMRSFDYSHFEITIGATIEDGDDSLWCTDDLRKQAARLADKAVSQYKIAKANRVRLQSEERDHQWAAQSASRIREKPETDRSPQEKAELKAFDDIAYERSRRYNYEDQWDDDDDDETID